MGGTRTRSYSFLPAPLKSGALGIVARSQEMLRNAAVRNADVG